MAFGMIFRLITIISAIATTIAGQPSPIFAPGNSMNLAKGDHSNPHFVSEDNPEYISKPMLASCAGEGQMYDTPREFQGKESYSKVPTFHLDSPRSFLEDRLFLALGGLRQKKAQKAILLDVGDYVIKSNGSPGEQPARSSGGGGTMGGILRSSG